MTKLENMLIDHEGIRFKPYQDTLGIWTCGIGHNMQRDGKITAERINETWTMEKVMTTLKNDIADVLKELNKFAWYTELDGVRKDALADMAFNLGIPRLLGFRNMIEALREKDYTKAADEMLDSTWAKQVGRRARDLAEMMRTGEYAHDV